MDTDPPPIHVTKGAALVPLSPDGAPDFDQARKFPLVLEDPPRPDTPTTTVHVTPLGPDGRPDTTQAQVFKLTESLHITLGGETRGYDDASPVEPLPDLVVHGLPPAPPGPAWITDPNHPRPMDGAALARHLRWHARVPAAVETWVDGPAGTWTHVVIPRCRPREGTHTDQPRT